MVRSQCGQALLLFLIAVVEQAPTSEPVLVTDLSCCQRNSDPGMLLQSQLLSELFILFFFDRKLSKATCCLHWCVWSTTGQSWETPPRLMCCQMGQQSMTSAPALSTAPMGPTPWMSLCRNLCSVSSCCHISHLELGAVAAGVTGSGIALQQHWWEALSTSCPSLPAGRIPFHVGPCSFGFAVLVSLGR